MEIYEKLGFWYDNEKRDLPWRNTSDPYKIWLSEIILQQTRVVQGIVYYHIFLKRFPDVFSLARAETDEVLKIWQGLGYYSRARNLHETARKIAFEKNGMFPDTYSELLKLKGIGEYSAAAISSITHNEPRAAVDGNVKRVISRLFSIDQPIDSSEGKRVINLLAGEILDIRQPGRHNQAMMELGANICLPKKPKCLICPLNSECLALKDNKVSDLPVKYQKTKVKNRFFIYIIIRDGDTIRLQRRKKGDIWEGLYEFPLIETKEIADLFEFPGLIADYFKIDFQAFQITRYSEIITHKLSHLNIICRFLSINVSENLDTSKLPGIELHVSEFDKYAVSKLIERYISDSGFLNTSFRLI
jgi:A/G-specific adenine glycosylase